jgi:hypothetical protein
MLPRRKKYINAQKIPEMAKKHINDKENATNGTA